MLLFSDNDRDFQYNALVRKMEDVAMNFAVEGVRSKHLLPAARAFSANISRTANFVMMPAQISGFLLAKENDPVDSLTLGIGYVESMAHSHPMEQSLDAMLSTVVLESWTAFECLAADVWFAAVDHFPLLRKKAAAKLPKLVTKSSDLDTDEEDDDFDETKFPDPIKGYGSSLKGTVSFQKLPRIVTNYKVLFGKRIRDIFKTNDNYLAALVAARNLLMHKAGRVDDQFIARVKAFPEFGGAEHDKPLQLDGEIVNKLRDAAIQVALKLIIAADNVLSPV
jgi:hypothetical protein